MPGGVELSEQPPADPLFPPTEAPPPPLVPPPPAPVPEPMPVPAPEPGPGPPPEPEPAPVAVAPPALMAPAHDPAADYAADLQPGGGRPLVTGAPVSVQEPIAAPALNTLFGIGAVILLVVTVIVVLLLAVFVFSLLGGR